MTTSRSTHAGSSCFKKLVINTIIPEALDPLQFAYRPNRSTDDTISIKTPVVKTSLHSQFVRVGNNTSAMLIINTGSPQG